MISYEQWLHIRQLATRDKLSITQIALTQSLSRSTVRKALRQKSYSPRRKVVRSSILDPYKGRIVGLLREHSYSAVQLLALLREEGYEGGVSILKEYITQVRPRHRQAYLTLAFAPGECAQVDWGSWQMIDVEGSRRRLSFFVMVLAYSRMIYAEFSLSQSQEHFLSAHRRAFEFFGGVPEKIMVDNCKTAVLSHPFGLNATFNPRYGDFAAHYGFAIKACNVRKANEKGIVENAVGYIKKSFLNGRPITQFASLNPALAIWLADVANVRVHARTKERPLDLLVAEERLLRPLPIHPYDCATITSVRVDRQFRVRVETNRYSVPPTYASRQLLLKLYPERLCLYDGEKMVAEHVRSYAKHRDFEHPEHVRVLLERKKRSHEQHLLKRFLALSPKSEQYYRELAERRFNWRLELRKIVALSDVYGAQKVAQAIEDALQFHAFSSDYICAILEQQERRLPDPGPLHLAHKRDLLDLELPPPDISIYEKDE